MVCLGNICRSPLMEGVLKHKLAANNLNAYVDSAGTGSWHIGKLPDLRSIHVAKEHGIKTVADNTFATPFNQRPLEMGVDAVIHSGTKYLGGHSDLTAGVIVGTNEIVESVRHAANKFYGGNIAPQVAWLVMRGIKTLALRMERHNGKIGRAHV